MAITVVDRKGQYYLTLLFVAAGWLFLFRNEFSLLKTQWDSEDYSYCYLVPLIAGYVAWQNRTLIADNQDNTFWPGLLGVLVSGLFLFAGRLGSLETFIFFSMWLSLVSISIVLLGAKAFKYIAFPALILLFIVPPPAFIERTLSFNLRLVSSQLSAQLLYLLSVPVYLEGNIIDLGTIKLQVVDACSGLRYFLPTILLSLIIGYSFNKRLISRILLVLLSAPITIALNAIRITITGILVRYISPTLADGFFHDFQGWVVYLAAIALLSSCSYILNKFEHEAPIISADTDKSCTPDEVACKEVKHAHGLTAPLAVGLLFVMLSLGMSWFIRDQTIPAWKSLDSFPLTINDWRGTRTYLDKLTLDSLWADDYFLASYQNTSTNSTLNLLVPYYKTQTAQHTAHAPTSCLLGSGWEIEKREVLGPSTATGRVFTVQQLILVKNGRRLLSNFWFHQRGRIIANEFENKAYLLYDALTIHRTDGALIRIEMLIPQGVTVEQAQAELDPFSVAAAQTLSTYLPGLHENSLASDLR